MTAEEALQLSPTGFVWTTDGTPIYLCGDVWLHCDGVEVMFATSTGWHPLPPSLREKESNELSEVDARVALRKRSIELLTAKQSIAELERENAELKKQLDNAPQKLKRKPLSEPPNDVRSVIIWNGSNVRGVAHHDGHGWSFMFAHYQKSALNYTWTEVPEVE